MPSDSSSFEGARNAPIIAQALSDQGEAALHFGDLTAAAATLQEAVSRWRELDEPASLAAALNNLALSYLRVKEPARAIPLLTEAVGLFDAVRNIMGKATALHALGTAYVDMGNYSQALTHLQAALPLRRQAGDTSGELLTIDSLAHLSSTMGDRLAAVAYRREQLQLARTAGDRRTEADTMVELAAALSATGYNSEAMDTLWSAVEIYEQLGQVREAGETLLKLAQAHVEAGDLDASVPPVEKALPMLRQAGAWGPQAVQWESFLSSRRMQQQLGDAFGQWRRGDSGGIDAMLDAARQRLGSPGTGPMTPVNEQLLEMLANSATRLAGITPGQPSKLPSTDELAAQDTRSMGDLISTLHSSDTSERRKAALALGVRGDLSAVEPLIRACEDRNQWVRMAAVRSLGKLKDVRAFDALCKRVVEDRDKEVRRSSATALGALGDKRAVDALTLALTDSYYRTVESAEKALRKLKAPPNVDALLALLTHKDVLRRFAAADRLARHGDTSAVGPLAQEAEDFNQPVEARVAMLKALTLLNNRRGIEAALRILDGARPASATPDNALDPTLQLKQAALAVIAAAEDPAGLASVTPQLLSYLADANPYVRHVAVKALGAVGDQSAIPPLERIQQSDDDKIFISSQPSPRWQRLPSAAAEAIDRIRGRYSETQPSDQS